MESMPASRGSRITAVLFDLDGLLSDTEPLHCRAYQDVFRGLGIALDEETYIEEWVRLGRGICSFLRKRGIALDPDVIRERKAARYRELVRAEARPMPGAVELLDRLHGRKRVALASSAYADAVETVVDTLGLRGYFQAIVSHGHVERVKPFPDIFLYAAKALGVPPGECVVLEDAEKGVIAAREAGMTCIAIPNAYTRHNDFSRATRVVPSLRAVTLDLIDAL